MQFPSWVHLQGKILIFPQKEVDLPTELNFSTMSRLSIVSGRFYLIVVCLHSRGFFFLYFDIFHKNGHISLNIMIIKFEKDKK